MKKILFQEDQKFTRTWIAVLVYGITIINIAVFGYGFTQQILLGKTWGNTPMSDSALILTFILVLGIFAGLLVLLHRAALITIIHEEGINFKFPPFFLNERLIPKDEISQIGVRQYNPILEYGGWGVRIGLGKGKAYNVKGNLGIQLHLKNGKKILIGTQKKDQAEWAIIKMMESDK